MRFISLDEAERNRLHQIRQEGQTPRERHRAHALLLSADGYTINQLARIFFVDRDTITRWFKRWEDHGGEAGGSLADAPRSGRPPHLNADQEREALQMVLAEPRQIKRGLAQIQQHFRKRFSLDWLRRLLRKAGYRYKRCRTSLRARRNEQAFRKAQADLQAFQEQEAAGLVELFYLDEAGFSLTPSVPYAWQPTGERIEWKQTSKCKLNVLALMRTHLEASSSDFVPFVTESSVTSETVIACLDHFAAQRQRGRCEARGPGRTVIVLDNAPTHTSHAFEAARARWARAGIELYFLPAYSPELNLIEHLWKQIKHYWMPLWAFESFERFQQALDEVLIGIGTTYRITFA